MFGQMRFGKYRERVAWIALPWHSPSCSSANRMALSLVLLQPRVVFYSSSIDVGVFLGKTVLHEFGQSIDGILGVRTFRFQQ